MALFEVMYPVNFTSSGDQTRHAIGKHIKEIEQIYKLLNGIRRLSGGDTPPLQPEALAGEGFARPREAVFRR